MPIVEAHSPLFIKSTYAPSFIDVGCRNNRRVCAVYCNKTSGFEVVHGVLDRLMHVLEVAYEESGKPGSLSYRLEEVSGKRQRHKITSLVK